MALELNKEMQVKRLKFRSHQFSQAPTTANGAYEVARGR